MRYDEYNEQDSLNEESHSAHEIAQTIPDINSFANQAQKFAKRMNDNTSAKQPSSSNNVQHTTPNTGTAGTNTSAAGANASAASTSTSTGAASSVSAGSTAGTATTGTTAAAGATTMGIGAIAIVVIAALKKGGDAAKQNEVVSMDEAESSSEGGLSSLLFAILIIVIIILAAIITAPAVVLLNLATNPISTVSSTAESYFALEKKQAFFNDLLGEDYDILITSPREMNEETIGIYKEIVDYAILQAFDTYVWNLLTDLNTYKDFLFDGYNPYATYQKFLDNPYPYALAKEEDGQPYTIREFLENPDAIENNDLNYAEIFTILCQNPQFSFANFSYSDFYDVMVSKKTTELLFEMEIGDIHYYKYEAGESQSNIKNGIASGGNKLLTTSPSLNNTLGRYEYNETQMEQHIKNIEIATNPDYYTYVGSKTTYHYKYVAPKTDYVKDYKGSYKYSSSGITFVGIGKGTHSPSTTHYGNYNADGSYAGTNAGDYIQIKNEVPAGDYTKDGDTFVYVGANNGDYIQNTSAMESTKTNWWEAICNAWNNFWHLSITIAEDIMDKIILWGEHFFFVYDVTVKPYGLEEMYSIAGVSYDGYNHNNPYMKNYELLDYQEMWLRELLPSIDLGPSYSTKRSTRSVIYYDIEKILYSEGDTITDTKPTGRSLMNYLKNSFVNVIINGHTYYPEWSTGEHIDCEINFNPYGETVILDMYSYINQGDYPDDKRGPLTSIPDTRDSIKKSGCIDCSYIMLYEYYFRNELNVPAICLNYVKDNLFQTSDFMQDYNLTAGTTGFGNTPFSEDLIIKQITEGKPIILYLEGKWEYNGKCYHGSSNGHFLLIVGYDENGFYVYDPGSRSNTQSGCIPYDAFNYLSIKFLRTVEPKPGSAYTITYKINTLSGIGG